MSQPIDDLSDLNVAFALAGAAIFQGVFLAMLRAWPESSGRDWIAQNVADSVVQKRLTLVARFEELYDTGLPMDRVFSTLVDEGFVAEWFADSPLENVKLEKRHDA